MIKLPQNLKVRSKYIDKINPFIGKSIIKVLTGQRRVGKSYTLYQLIDFITGKDTKANIIYINKEDMKFDNLRDDKSLYDYIKSKLSNNKFNYIFIDEIQEIQHFEKALRSLLLSENTDIYCTGSNASLLSGELSSLLSGRFIAISIHSLSYPEFLEFHEKADSDKSLYDYIKYGGLPYLINLPMEEEIIFEYLENIYTSIIYRDIIARYNLRNTALLEKFVKFLADNIGNIFSAKRISDLLKSIKINMAPNQVLTYIQYLANAFLIFKAERYDLVGKRIFDSGEKFYFENTGIRNAIVGYKPNDMGKILENLVFNHVISKEYKVYVGQYNNNEIDFVCERHGEKLYLQVALHLQDEKTIDREFGNLLKIDDNYPKKVITMGSFSGNSYLGIEHVNIRDFLLS